jgi:hypothetical protein
MPSRRNACKVSLPGSSQFSNSVTEEIPNLNRSHHDHLLGVISAVFGGGVATSSMTACDFRKCLRPTEGAFCSRTRCAGPL